MDVKWSYSSGTTPAAAEGSRRRRASNKSSSGTSTVAVERKEIERMRRQHLKSLCLKLASLIPKEHCSSKDTMTQQDSLDEAATYIKKLKERVDELQQKRTSAQLSSAAMRGGASRGGRASTTSGSTSSSGGAGSEKANEEASSMAVVPVVEVRHHHDGSSLDVVLISGVERPFKLHEVVTVLEEEGAEIVNANFSVAGHKIFITIHSRAFISRIGIQVSRVSERLKALV